jgi:hypothetical protein
MHLAPERASVLAAAVCIAASIAASLPLVAGASSDVAGEASEYTSPTGVHERCVMLDHMPGGVYSDLLRRTCKAGLRFDLEPRDFLATGRVQTQRADCAP